MRNVINIVAPILYYISPVKMKLNVVRASVSPAALTQGVAQLTVKTFHICGEADYTASGHSKSRREHKDFGPDQSAILLERFQRQILTFWPVFF